MSEDPTRTKGSGPAPEQDKGTPDLGNELREMGQQLEAAFRAAVESEQAKQLKRDLAGGIRELSSQVQTALKSLQTNPRFQQAEERGRQALSQARQSKAAQDLQETVVVGIAQINDQLRKLVERLEQERVAQANTPSTQVPIDQEPSTGETTRLEE